MFLSKLKGGIYAEKYKVYLGTSMGDVNNVKADNLADYPDVISATVNESTYAPGTLDFNTIYYWRIDDINSAQPDKAWSSDVCNFSTGDFLMVEDFEDYNDYPPDEIWNTWVDGFGTTTNGSTAGYPDPVFADGEHYVETVVVRGGAQAMPLFYDNNLKYSEVTATLVYPTDWTAEGVGKLSLWIRGEADNAVERLYFAANGAAVYNDDPAVAQTTTWTEWVIPLQAFADQDVDLTNVNSISIGLGDKNNLAVGGSGVIYVDDIRLHRP